MIEHEMSFEKISEEIYLTSVHGMTQFDPDSPEWNFFFEIVENYRNWFIRNKNREIDKKSEEV